jgi:hypothetical protein
MNQEHREASMDNYFDSDTPTDPPAEAEVTGWGADRNPKDRPGVPQETPPEPMIHTNTMVQQQTDEPKPLVGPNRFLTPVYSTALPVRGLSGVLRRAAYKLPDHKPQRWMLLLAADRVDVLEHMKLGRAAVGVGVFVLALSLLKAIRA